MNCNTVAVPLWKDDHNDTRCESFAEYVSVLRDAASLGKNVILLCNFSDFDVKTLDIKKTVKYLDFFILPHQQVDNWVDFSSGALGALTFGFGMREVLTMRVIRLVSPSENVVEKRNTMVDLIKRKARFRIGKKGSLIFCESSQEILHPEKDIRFVEQMNRLIMAHKTHETHIVLMLMPSLASEDWLQRVQALVHNLGPTILISKDPRQELMSRRL